MNIPLPPGWSAKYDQNQRRYFFIDHSTQKTTWEDPRSSQQHTLNYPAQYGAYGQAQSGQHQNTSQRQQQSPRQRAAANVQGVFGQQHKKPQPLAIVSTNSDDEYTDEEDDIVVEVDESKVKELLAQYPTCNESFIRRKLESNMGMVAMTVSDIEHAGFMKKTTAAVNENLVRRLKEQFPDAPVVIIEEVTTGCDNISSEAIRQLREMGYKEKEENSTPHRASVQKTDAGPSSSSPQRLTEGDKQMMIKELSADFPGSSNMVVEMVLETVNYDDGSARSVLRTMGPEVHKKRDAPRKESTSNKVASPTKVTSPIKVTSPAKVTSPSKAISHVKLTSPTKKPESGKASQKKVSSVVFTPDADKKKLFDKFVFAFPDQSRTVIETALMSCDYDEQRTRSLLIRGIRARSPSKPTQLRQTSSPKKSEVSHSATPALITAPKSSKSSSSMSHHTPTAVGPNPSLRKGPDTTNLLTNYVQICGPNQSLHHGPNPDNVKGSQRAVGPDRSLRCGPQTQMRRGPNIDNVAGGGVTTS